MICANYFREELCERRKIEENMRFEPKLPWRIFAKGAK